jgi:hypothetical protein
MEQITNSYNLFIDSSRSHTSNSKGDDILINLQDAGVHAGEGEIIRMNLENFSMAKVFSDVNANNNQIQLRASTPDSNNNPVFVANQNITLTPKDYNSVFDLATEFKDKMIVALEAMGTKFGLVILKPNSFVTPSSATESTDNVIEFTLTYSGTAAAGTAKVYVQMFSEESDSYMLLGGDRIQGPKSAASTAQSISVVPSESAKEITFKCRYPAQRSTMPFIYVRAPGVLNTNIETKGLKDVRVDHKSDTAHSDILGRVVVSSKEWVQYTAQTGREFFLDIHQKQLNHIRLKLTDAKNRPIGRSTSSTNPNTATGSGNAQSTLGNLSFSAVIRFDIIKKRTVDHLETEHYKPTVPARFSNGVTNQQRFGKDTFGMGPGF